jgi:hypothetical protein
MRSPVVGAPPRHRENFSVFYTLRVVSKERRRLVLPRTSCSVGHWDKHYWASRLETQRSLLACVPEATGCFRSWRRYFVAFPPSLQANTGLIPESIPRPLPSNSFLHIAHLYISAITVVRSSYWFYSKRLCTVWMWAVLSTFRRYTLPPYSGSCGCLYIYILSRVKWP